MSIGTIVRESAAVACFTVAACATAKVGNDLGNIVKKITELVVTRLTIDSWVGCAVECLPWNNHIKEGFELLTQEFFVGSRVRLSVDLAKKTVKDAFVTTALVALAYKVAQNSCLVNTAVTVLSGATRAVASRIV